MGFLSNKRVLIICPEFHYYHEMLIHTFKSNGAEVDFIPTYKSRSKSQKKIEHHYKEKFDLIATNRFDLLFQIRGEDIPKKFYLPFIEGDTKLVSYQWDSLNNYNYKHLLGFFDLVYSFDRLDSESNQKIDYMPLFYWKQSIVEHKEIEFDLSLVGGYADWRYYKVLEILDSLGGKNIRSFVKLKISLTTFLKKLLKFEFLRMKLITFSTIDKELYDLVLSKTKVVLDIPSPKQRGLTIRTIEAISNNMKLITTNEFIEKESFYSPESMWIYNESNADKTNLLDFINKDLKVDNDIEYLEINSWIKHLFSPLVSG